MPTRIGVFGGSFDPPHLGHLIAAQAAVEHCELDRVLWVPTGESYHKDDTSAASDRAAMVAEHIAGNPAFALSEVDVLRGGPTYTVDTIADLQRQFPDAAFTLILGSDAYAGLTDWHRGDELLAAVSLAIVTRAEHEHDDSHETSLRWVRIPIIGISSTECRERVRAGLSLRYLTTRAVERYIAAHHLYSEN